MPIPAYVQAIRQSYGQGLLFLPGVSGVVLDGPPGRERVLLVRRSDNGRWTLPAGIVEPGEQPADTLVREVLEEACVRIRVDRLALLTVDDELTYPNADRCQFLSMAFRCRYVDGEARVGDEECIDVGWFDLSALPDLSSREQRRIAVATSASDATVFDATIA